MKKEIMIILTIAVIVGLCFSLAEARSVSIKTKDKLAQNSKDINCGDTIYQDTTLTNDLMNCGGNGIIIGSNGITLDCNDYTIDGTNNGQFVHGVYLNNKQNVIIKNCDIKDFYNGVYVHNSNNININNNEIYETYDGISIHSSDGNDITYNTITNNHHGVHLWIDEPTLNVLSENSVSDNYQGIRLEGAVNNEVTNNDLSYNSAGISLDSAGNDNLISENDISNNIRGINLMWLSQGNTFWDNELNDNYYANAFEDYTSNNNQWDYNGIGNQWDDFSSNPGYPNEYYIDGPGNGIDHYPNQQECSDGTQYGGCSADKPKYCDNGQLINNCEECGCDSSEFCKSDGSCNPAIGKSVRENISAPSFY